MPRGTHLGDLEELVLLAVLRLAGDAHGGRIRDELVEHAARKVSISTIYVTLMRLEEKGYLRSWKGEKTAGRGGKAKRMFEIRPEGVQALEAVRAIRDHMWDGVEADAR